MMNTSKMKTTFLVLLTNVFALIAGAQDPITVRIGNKIPEFKYSKWLKGEPVKSFKGDNLYILEFWATWCGPCKAQMPHLTKLQKKYKDKITIIGVNVWERVGEKPYETALPSVEKYVKGNDTNMVYSIAVDNNDQHMGSNWLKASGNYGIPTTFIVKDEKIIWIGHPEKLDSTLQVMMAGTYNMQAYKSEYDKTIDRSAKQTAAIQDLIKPITEAINAKDYAKALELIEQGKIDMPNMKTNLDITKFSVLVKIDEKRAVEFVKEWATTFKSAPLYAMSGVYQENGLSKETYLWVAKNLEGSGLPMNAAAYHALATTYAKGGDFKAAITNEEKALEQAKIALKEGKMVGTIMDYTIKEYQEALSSYKNWQIPQPKDK